MIPLLKRFFDDVHGLVLAFIVFSDNPLITVALCQEDRDLLANYRRYAPRAKKETV